MIKLSKNHRRLTITITDEDGEEIAVEGVFVSESDSFLAITAVERQSVNPDMIYMPTRPLSSVVSR